MKKKYSKEELEVIEKQIEQVLDKIIKEKVDLYRRVQKGLRELIENNTNNEKNK